MGFSHQAQLKLETLCSLRIYWRYIENIIFSYESNLVLSSNEKCLCVMGKNWLFWLWQLILSDVLDDLVYYRIHLCLQNKIWHLITPKEVLDYLAPTANNQMKNNNRTAVRIKCGLPISDLEQDLNVVAVNSCNHGKWSQNISILKVC